MMAKAPGTVDLLSRDGSEVGSWKTEGMPGQGDGPNANREVFAAVVKGHYWARHVAWSFP